MASIEVTNHLKALSPLAVVSVLAGCHQVQCGDYHVRVSSGEPLCKMRVEFGHTNVDWRTLEFYHSWEKAEPAMLAHLQKGMV